MSVYECCSLEKDFITKRQVHVCAAHGFRGLLPCPYPGCNSRNDIVLLADAGTSTRYYPGDLIPFDAIDFAIKHRFQRSSVAIGDSTAGMSRCYYWERVQ